MGTKCDAYRAGTAVAVYDDADVLITMGTVSDCVMRDGEWFYNVEPESGHPTIMDVPDDRIGLAEDHDAGGE